MIATKLALLSLAVAGCMADPPTPCCDTESPSFGTCPCEDSPQCAGFDPEEHVYVAQNHCTEFFQCFGGTHWGTNPCPAGLLFNEEIDVCDWPYDTVCVPDLEWVTSTTNINTNGGDGWTISNDGLCIRLDINDSANCGGPNSSTQTATASVTFNTIGAYDLSVAVTGRAELFDPGFERLQVFIDGDLEVTAVSAGGGSGCQMGPPTVTDITMQPSFLSAGSHTIAINFSTLDSLFHRNAFYKLCFDFDLPSTA